jgi:hypothetical protein
MHEDCFTLSVVEREIVLKPLPQPESGQTAQP